MAAHSVVRAVSTMKGSNTEYGMSIVRRQKYLVTIQIGTVYGICLGIWHNTIFKIHIRHERSNQVAR